LFVEDLADFGLRDPMHSTSSLAFSIVLARLSPICVGIALFRLVLRCQASPALPAHATLLWLGSRCRRRLRKS
jgi:hypothetical protein